MSVQSKSYVSKATGKKSTKYYPVVYDPKTDKHVWGLAYPTEREAKKHEGDLLNDLDSGKIKAGKHPKETFGSVGDLWVKSSKSDFADSTYRIYKYDYEHFLRPIFEDQPIDKIAPVHLAKWKTICEDENGYKPEMINKLITIFANIFNFAIKLEIITSSPMGGLSRCRVPETKHTTWDEDQINYFLNLPSVVESPYYTMLIVMFATGARPGEICGLSETDLTQTGVLTLNRGLNRYGHLSDLKNDRSHRPLKIAPELADLIREQIKFKRKAEFMGLTEHKDYLFICPNGNPVKPDILSKAFKRLLKQNNKEYNDFITQHGKAPENRQELPDMRMYDTRHSFATNLMISGKKSKIIAEVMGNSTKTMEHHYAHVTEAMHEEILAGYGDKIIPIRKLG